MKSSILLIILSIAINLTSYSQKTTTYGRGNCKDGEGIIKTKTYYFKGYFLNKLPHGYGEMKTDEWEYKGNFRAGMRDGKGFCTFNNGTEYDGFWEQNSFNSGVVNFPNGARYEGSFRNNIFHGIGTYEFEKQHPEKIKYVGNFEDGYYSGYGALSTKNGNVIKGIWEKDMFKGRIIGSLNNDYVLYNNKDEIITLSDNKYYAFSKMPLFSLKQLGIDYFYIIYNQEIEAIVTKSTDLKDSVKLITKENSPVLLELLNRNKYNRPAKGKLTKMTDWLYFDENNCVWALKIKDNYLQNNYINFYRPSFTNPGVHETVLQISDGDKSLIASDKFPQFINGKMVTDSYFQQHFQFVEDMKIFSDNIYKRGFIITNNQLHEFGWYEYAKFDIKYDSYPNKMELGLIDGYYAVKGKTVIIDSLPSNENETFYCPIIELGIAINGKLQYAELEIIDIEMFLSAFNNAIPIDNSKNVYQIAITDATIQSSDLIFLKYKTDSQYITIEANIDNSDIQDDFNNNYYEENNFEEEQIFDNVINGAETLPSFKLILTFSAFAYSQDAGWVVLNPYFIKM